MRKRDGARVKVHVRHGESNNNSPKICICARTAAIIWRAYDHKHKGNNPKMPRQTNLRVLKYCFVGSLHLHACVELYSLVIICACVYACMWVCVRCHAIHTVSGTTVQHPFRDAWYSSKHMCLDIACHDLFAHSNLVLFVRRIITQHTLLKHSFTTVICDFRGGNQVWRAQNVLQRLLFIHCQRSFVEELGSEKYSKANKVRTISINTAAHAFSQCGRVTHEM